MPCLWPRKAWRQGDTFTFKTPAGDPAHDLIVPCGGCVECRVRRAREWAIRCQLELKEHDSAAWATLTYDDAHLVRPPPEHFGELAATLSKSHLSGYMKRLRARVRSRIRFFGVGEYGERTHRPHYHVILYGVDRSCAAIEKAWPYGHVRVDPVTPNNIAYTAGYANKKIRAGHFRARDYVDPDTGELFEWQEPFRLVSRRPGIGGAARRFARSWRSTAILNGRPVPVPRYLHDAWRAVASASDIEDLELERSLTNRARSYEERDAAEAIAEAKHQLAAEKRRL